MFETIRVEDGVPMHLHWHQERVNRSFVTYFKKPGAPNLRYLIKVPDDCMTGLFKCRFFYNRSSHSMEFSPYLAREVRSLQLVRGDHISYEMKFTDRDSLDALQSLKGNCDDVLIVKRGMVTDTTYTNICFFDGEQWVTPSEPLLSGTCRQRLLDEKKIIEASIRVEDLSNYVSFRLINAMVDFDSQEPVPLANIRL